MKNRSSFCKISVGMLIFALSTPALLVGCSSPQPKTEGAFMTPERWLNMPLLM